ncbi:MAG: endonuclease V [Planctomycetaceae bacterium]|nr:endonuclease V [Planctomycetaceae bacterium]
MARFPPSHGVHQPPISTRDAEDPALHIYNHGVHRDAFLSLLDVNLPAELWRLIAQVPRGCVTTYGALADALGDRVAARWVGELLMDHAHDVDCPCHRVVRRNGEPGLYIAGGAAAKLSRLASEGIPIEHGRASLERHFAGFQSAAPLRGLKEFQQQVPARLDLRCFDGTVRRIAALDMAYVSSSTAVAVGVIADATSLETMSTLTITSPVMFPYISGYLAFRELPALLSLWKQMQSAAPAADVVLIDGNGSLHPRRAGIAACFGLLTDVPTIGIGKSLLCGRVDVAGLRVGDTRPVIDRDELIGLAVKSADRSRPIFVSAGNYVDIPQAAQLVQRMFAGHRLPEPLHQADRLTKQRVRELRMPSSS